MNANKKSSQLSNLLLIYFFVYFALTLINVIFALLGFLCFVVPFIILYVRKKNDWCRFYCPRANMFTRLLSKISLNRKVTRKSIEMWKKIVAYYFVVNIIFIIMTTFMVAIGRSYPIDSLRFLILFEWPFTVPQVMSIGVHPVITHLSFRVFSLMFTSSIIGIIVGIIYFPKVWCTVCPMKQSLNQLKS